MKRLLEVVLHEINEERPAVLCTVIESDGSVPRGAGAKMAVFSDGRTLGTVGGGAVEIAARERASELLRTGKSAVSSYSLSAGGAQSTGMVCGGTVKLCFCFLDKSKREFIKALLKALDSDGSYMVLRMQDNVVAGMGLYYDKKLCFMKPDCAEDMDRILRDSPTYLEGMPAYYAEPVRRAERCIVFGAGHVGRALVPLLVQIGFRVTVYDNREQIALPLIFPEAEEVVCGSFSETSGISISVSDYIVVMTPGHRDDYSVLSRVLSSKACYIGCIGSKKKAAYIREKLIAAGFSKEDADRVHSPIGIDIGACTPEEIAVSIAAEMIRHRAEIRKKAGENDA